MNILFHKSIGMDRINNLFPKNIAIYMADILKF
jgi:hypothetical protein